MKTLKVFAVLATAAMTLACAPKAVEDNAEADAQATVENSQVKNIKDLLPTKAEVDSVSYLIGINFGYFIKMNNFGEDLNYSQIKKGMMDFINSKGNMNDPEFNDQFKVSPEAMNDLFSQFIQKRSDYQAEKNKQDGEKFLEKNKTKEGVVTTESGLQYKVVAEGDGTPINENDTLSVYYTGTYVNGEEFDSKKEEDGEPFQFELRGGYRGVIQGWVEGLQLATKGEELELYIPSELAYGKNAYNMEPNQTLVFKIKVVDVKPFVAPEGEATEEEPVDLAPSLK